MRFMFFLSVTTMEMNYSVAVVIGAIIFCSAKIQLCFKFIIVGK